MKTLIFIVSLSLIGLGCSRTTTTPSGSGDAFRFIPNWKQDTLMPIPHAGASHFDTMVSNVSGDTSYVMYHGTKLYLFYLNSVLPHHSDSDMVHLNCYLSPVAYDTVSAWSKCTVSPSKYYSDSYHSWKDQNLVITLSSVYPHFDTSQGNMFISF